MTKGALKKRSMRISGHRTSIALEEEFWAALEAIALARNTSLPKLVATIDNDRDKSPNGPSLASAVRVFVLKNRP